MTRRAPQLAVACLLATACANSNHHATRPPRTHVQPLAAPITVTAQTPAATPAAVRRRGGVNGSPAAACSVVVRFADAYPRYLTATLAARRLPRLAPSGLATVAQTGRLPTRLRHLQLRAVGIEQHGTSWMIRYITSIAGHRATLSSRVTLTRTPDGWQIAQITPPDLDQLIAQHPPSTPVPTLVRVAAVAFTRSYLAYTYAHGPAAALTHLTPPRTAREHAADRPRGRPRAGPPSHQHRLRARGRGPVARDRRRHRRGRRIPAAEHPRTHSPRLARHPRVRRRLTLHHVRHHHPSP
jgi:hypothetical protein